MSLDASVVSIAFGDIDFGFVWLLLWMNSELGRIMACSTEQARVSMLLRICAGSTLVGAAWTRLAKHCLVPDRADRLI